MELSSFLARGDNVHINQQNCTAISRLNMHVRQCRLNIAVVAIHEFTNEIIKISDDSRCRRMKCTSSYNAHRNNVRYSHADS